MNLLLTNGQKKYYLQNEVETFLNLIETIARMRKVRVFLLGNAGNILTNPYFLYFDLQVPYNTDIKIYKDGLILVQYMNNEEYRNKKKNTDFGRLVAGTSYEKFAIENQDNHLNNDFIEKKKGTSRFCFGFIYNGNTFGIWIDNSLGKYFVSKDYDKQSPYIFATTLADHSENTMLLKNIRRYACWKNFIDNYNMANVRFENQKVKNITMDLLKKILIR